MSAANDFERTLATWLERDGPTDVPERVITAAFAEARTVRQRRAWLPTSWWLPRVSRNEDARTSTQPIGRDPGRTVGEPLRLVWIVALVGLLAAAALGAAMVGSALFKGSDDLSVVLPLPTVTSSPEVAATTPSVVRRDVPLSPSGLEPLNLALGCETGQGAAVDGSGVLWLRGPTGQVTRFDPVANSGRSWTVADDAALYDEAEADETSLTPAREGGVWLVGRHTLRLFDGTAFRQVIEVPASVATATEAEDGALWVVTTDGYVLRWDGSAWTTLDAELPNPEAVINAIAVDSAGRPWLGWIRTGTSSDVGWVSRHDGSSWTHYYGKDAAPLRGDINAIAALPDGSIWVASSRGVARFDGTAWTDVTANLSAHHNAQSLAAESDGTVWAASKNDDGGIFVSRYDGDSWSSSGPSDGLPTDDWVTPSVGVLPATDRPYVATGRGTYVRSDGRWERIWPNVTMPCDSGSLLAVSHDELWAVDGEELWHFRDSAWETEPYGTGRTVFGLALASDGTVWAAGDDGVAFYRDGRWAIADAHPAIAIAIGPDGTIWAAGGCDAVLTPTPAPTAQPMILAPTSAAGCGAPWALRPEGSTWVRSALAADPLSAPVESLAVDGTGALWAASRNAGGLARFDGRRWEVVTEIVGAGVAEADIRGTAADGGMWVMFWTEDGGPYAARWDGATWTREAAGDYTVAPDGSVWRDLARYDGEQWTNPYAAIGLPDMALASVAPDGTVFVELGSGYFRLPTMSPSP